MQKHDIIIANVKRKMIVENCFELISPLSGLNSIRRAPLRYARAFGRAEMSFGSLTQGLRPGLQIRRRCAARALADGVHCQIIQIISVPRCLCGENQSRFLAALGMTKTFEIRVHLRASTAKSFNRENR